MNTQLKAKDGDIFYGVSIETSIIIGLVKEKSTKK
jgi:hypothetical protein